MSEFSVHRTADTIPALKYCLILDGERIAGGKPDYCGNNHLISWSTCETYGPVDQLNDENARLRTQLADVTESMGRVEERCAKLQELVRDVYSLHWYGVDCTECPWFDECDNHGGGCPWLGIMYDHMRVLGIEVN